MFTLYEIYQQPSWIILLICFVGLWEMVWKGFALWFAGKNRQKAWFVIIFIFNTAGLLPIIYLLWFRPKKNGNPEKELVKKKKLKKR